MPKIVIVGGGAAGFFAALSAAKAGATDICILEGSASVLGKVKISGGGRCNVTHDCDDPRSLVEFYPRGAKELLGPFHRFGPSATKAWFESAGVALKTEADGRVFPRSDRSQSIVNALSQAAEHAGVQVLTQQRVKELEANAEGSWRLRTRTDEFQADCLMVACGSSNALWRELEKLGLSVQPPVPSLFSLNTRDPRLRDLSGLSLESAELEVKEFGISASGPLLITHWGLSGPAALKVSAWGARELAACDYRFELQVNWLGGLSVEAAKSDLQQVRSSQSKKQVSNANPFAIPARLYFRLLEACGIDGSKRWAELSGKQADQLCNLVVSSKFSIRGKSTNKDEFVTAGGVDLSEMDFRSFRARRLENLYLAGEVLDIDALTGGFNFQAAWTGGWLAGKAMAEAVQGN